MAAVIGCNYSPLYAMENLTPSDYFSPEEGAAINAYLEKQEDAINREEEERVTKEDIHLEHDLTLLSQRPHYPDQVLSRMQFHSDQISKIEDTADLKNLALDAVDDRYMKGYSETFYDIKRNGNPVQRAALKKYNKDYRARLKKNPFALGIVKRRNGRFLTVPPHKKDLNGGQAFFPRRFNDE